MASTFKADIAGIRAALKSRPVRAEVEKATRRIAGAANSMAPGRHGYTGAPPYGCYVDDGVIVKVSFSNTKETIEDRLEAYIRSM